MKKLPPTHPPFALVLAGGGARGLAHVGVLAALERHGYHPSAIVGVSMGAIVGATYALNPDWYQALSHMDTTGFPEPPTPKSADFRERLRSLQAYERAAWNMLTGWGVGQKAQPYGVKLLERLTLGRNLQEGRIPVAAVATDLVSGERVVLREGRAAQLAYASAALAGVLPPLKMGEQLLADGAYADVAPVDVAWGFGASKVIAVDPSLPHTRGLVANVNNGLKALVRAMEICHHRHAYLRFEQASLVLRPRFNRAIDSLDFSNKHECIHAGLEVVEEALPRLRTLLEAEALAVD